jgi:hypothetical protein
MRPWDAVGYQTATSRPRPVCEAGISNFLKPTNPAAGAGLALRTTTPTMAATRKGTIGTLIMEDTRIEERRRGFSGSRDGFGKRLERYRAGMDQTEAELRSGI